MPLSHSPICVLSHSTITTLIGKRRELWLSRIANILKLSEFPELYSNVTDSAELVHNNEQSLELADILPIKARSYDKNRAPKLLGQPTVVYFHVTVLSIDSINEESMTYVTDIFLAQR